MSASTFTSEEIQRMILDEAKNQFLAKGIAETQMKDIAAKIGISRSTLYRYYPQKERLAFLITSQICEQLLVDSFSFKLPENACGFDKVESFCYHYIDNLMKNTSVLSYLSDFDRMFENEYPNIPEAFSFLNGIQKNNKLLASYLRQGQQDGSIVPYENPNLLASVLINTILSEAQRLFVRSDHFQQEHGYSGYQIIHKTVELLLRTLKSS